MHIGNEDGRATYALWIGATPRAPGRSTRARLAAGVLAAVLLSACGSDPKDTAAGEEQFPAHAATGVRTPQSSFGGTTTLRPGQEQPATSFWADKTVTGDGTIQAAAGDSDAETFLSAGRVLVVPLAAGGGEVRKVTAVTVGSGGLVATTAPAEITDLVDDATWAISVGGDAAKTDMVDPWMDIDLSGKSLLDKGDAGGPWSLKLEIAKGRIAGNPRFDLDVVVSHSDLHLFQLTSSGFFLLEANFELTGKAEKEFSKSIEIPLVEKEIVALVGGVPVWVTPYVKLEIKGEAKISGDGKVTAGFRGTLPGSFIRKWALEDKPHWSTDTKGRVTLRALPVKVENAEIAANGKLSLTAFVGLKLYRRVTAEIEAAVWTQLEAKVSGACTWELKAGADGKLTAKLDGFGPVEDKEASTQLFKLDKSLSKGSCGGGFGVDAGPTDAGADTSGGGGGFGGTPGCPTATVACEKAAMDCCAKVADNAYSSRSPVCKSEFDEAMADAAKITDATARKQAEDDAKTLKEACVNLAFAGTYHAKAACMKKSLCASGSFYGMVKQKSPELYEYEAACYEKAAECYTAQVGGAKNAPAPWTNAFCPMVLSSCLASGS